MSPLFADAPSPVPLLVIACVFVALVMGVFIWLAQSLGNLIDYLKGPRSDSPAPRDEALARPAARRSKDPLVALYAERDAKIRELKEEAQARGVDEHLLAANVNEVREAYEPRIAEELAKL